MDGGTSVFWGWRAGKRLYHKGFEACVQKKMFEEIEEMAGKNGRQLGCCKRETSKK